MPPDGLHRVGDAGKHRPPVLGEVGVGDVAPLPAHRPATRLHGDAVGAGAGDEHVRAGLDRQHRPLVLQQHERFGDGFARQRQMIGAADLLRREPVGAAAVEQAGLGLDPQNPAHRIVQPPRLDFAGPGMRDEAGVQPLPAVGRHVHVEPGVERGEAIGDAAAGDLAVRVPVADHQALEPHPALEHVGQQRTVAVVLDAVPAREADHDGERAGVDRRPVALRVPGDQLGLADPRVALVLAFERAAIGEEMLGRRDHMVVGDRPAGNRACPEALRSSPWHKPRPAWGPTNSLRSCGPSAGPAAPPGSARRSTRCPTR